MNGVVNQIIPFILHLPNLRGKIKVVVICMLANIGENGIMNQSEKRKNE